MKWLGMLTSLATVAVAVIAVIQLQNGDAPMYIVWETGLYIALPVLIFMALFMYGNLLLIRWVNRKAAGQQEQER